MITKQFMMSVLRWFSKYDYMQMSSGLGRVSEVGTTESASMYVSIILRADDGSGFEYIAPSKAIVEGWGEDDWVSVPVNNVMYVGSASVKFNVTFSNASGFTYPDPLSVVIEMTKRFDSVSSDFGTSSSVVTVKEVILGHYDSTNNMIKPLIVVNDVIDPEVFVPIQITDGDNVTVRFILQA